MQAITILSHMEKTMSAATTTKKMTVPAFMARKNTGGVGGGAKLVVLTAYSAPVAALLAPHVDALLVGDSVGMVYHGLPSTVGVTLEMMALHTAAVRRGAPDTFVIADLPFGTYHGSSEQAYTASVSLLQAGADAVKLEGGTELAATIEFLSVRGIPVMGHVGLMPQRINQVGTYAAQGRTPEAIARIKADAEAITKAGAFSFVIEGVLETIAAEITASVKIPTIGIGASQKCDGQVLVSDDVFGLFSTFTPKFVRKYADLAGEISKAAASYSADVKSGAFPSEKETFK